MDFGTSIVGLIFILICIIPFVLINRARLKKNKQLLQSLNEKAQQHNCKITKHELCGDFILGIDEQKNRLVFLKNTKEEANLQFVDLNEIKACQIIKKFRNNGTENSIVPEHIEFCFNSKDKNKAEIHFELYDEYVNMQLSGELQFAEKWLKQINERLKN